MRDNSNPLYDAAVVFRSLPEEQATQVLTRLDHASRQSLAVEVNTLGKIDAWQFHQITRRFRSQAFSEEYDSRSPVADSLLFHRDPCGDPDQAFQFLSYMDPEQRKTLLESEHPLNVALILPHLDPLLASTLMREFEEPFRISVMKRLCDLEDPEPDKLVQLRYALRMRVKKMMIVDAWRTKGTDIAARLLSLSDTRTQDTVLSWVNDEDPDCGRYLEYRIVRMEDIADLDDDSVDLLLSQVDTSAWAGALRLTRPSVTHRVLRAMAARPAEMLSKELANYDPSDTLGMQQAAEKVISVMIRLRDAGQLAFTGGPEAQ